MQTTATLNLSLSQRVVDITEKVSGATTVTEFRNACAYRGPPHQWNGRFLQQQLRPTQNPTGHDPCGTATKTADWCQSFPL
jgi:hypothetical protein